MNNKRPSGYVSLTCSFHQEKNKWVAVCVELGTSTFGNSLTDANKKLEEAIILHLDTLASVGEINNFFREHNIIFYKTEPRSVQVITHPADNNFVRSCIHKIGDLTPA